MLIIGVFRYGKMLFLCKQIIRTVLKPLLWKQSAPSRSNTGRSRTNYEISLKKRQRMMARDKVNKSFLPIYDAPQEWIVKCGYPIVVITAISGPSYYLYRFGLTGADVESDSFERKQNTKKRDFYLLIGTAVVFACAFLGVIFKYPYRVYKHNDKAEYIAIFQTVIPFRTSQLYYTKASETKFRNPFYFFVEDGQFLLGGKKAILMPYQFRTAYDLCQMIGVK